MILKCYGNHRRAVNPKSYMFSLWQLCNKDINIQFLMHNEQH